MCLRKYSTCENQIFTNNLHKGGWGASVFFLSIRHHCAPRTNRYYRWRVNTDVRHGSEWTQPRQGGY